ncbi:MAG: hypothetical protein ACO2PK_00645 [Armatimonadota bacterium]
MERKRGAWIESRACGSCACDKSRLLGAPTNFLLEWLSATTKTTANGDWRIVGVNGGSP